MSKYFIIPFVLIGVLLSFLFLQQQRDSAPFPRLVLLYATCSLNKNYLAPYNPEVRYTPHLEKFGKEAVVFTRHETEVGCSGPAYASLFSGNHVYRHGVYYQPRILDDKNYLIAEAFRDNGYDTFFWNAHSLASAKYNYAQGVKPQNVIHRDPIDGQTLTQNDPDLAAILTRLRIRKNYKVFVEANFTMTHFPYYKNSNVAKTQAFCARFPDECKGVTNEDLVKYSELYETNRASLQLHFEDTVKSLKLTDDEVKQMTKTMEVFYKSSVFLLDKSFGKTLYAIQQAGLENHTLIVFTADHGEVLFREGAEAKWGHCTLDPEVLSPALIVRAPGKLVPHLYTNVSSSIDVYPTVAKLASLTLPSAVHLDGKDLSTELIHGQSQTSPIAYSFKAMPHPGVYQADPRFSPVLGRYEDKFYKLNVLPNGTSQMQVLDWINRDQIKEESFNPKIAEDAKIDTGIRSYRSLIVKSYTPPEQNASWQEERERLRALGYIQ